MKKQYIQPSMKAYKVQPTTILAGSTGPKVESTTLTSDDFSSDNYEID